MPHLSPMKWFNLYVIMILWMMFFMIKVNFMFLIYPKKMNYKNFKYNLLHWKI